MLDTIGCESSGIPCGMQFPVMGGVGFPGCTYGSGSCGGMIYGFTDGAPWWAPKSNTCGWSVLNIFCHWYDIDILWNNKAADTALFIMTSKFATDPVLWAQTNSKGPFALAQINQLAQTNLALDAAQLAQDFTSLSQQYPQLLGKTVDQASNIVGQIRDQNNRNIDRLLGVPSRGY